MIQRRKKIFAEENVQNGGSHMAEKRYFEICGFANTVFYKRAMLQFIYAEDAKSALDIFSHLESMGPP